MNNKDKYIELIKGCKLIGNSVMLNNNDWAKLVKVNNRVMVENEHGTRFDLLELDYSEILLFCDLYQIDRRYDYLILSEHNEWLDTGKFSTNDEIKVALDEVKSKYGVSSGETDFVVMYSDKMSSYIA